MQSCRDCKFLSVKPGEKRLSNRMYPCTAPMPPMPKIPDSLQRSFAWPKPGEFQMTAPNYGVSCPTFEKRKK